MKYTKFILIILLLLAAFNCGTIEPEGDKDNAIPGKRNYTWDIDSIDYEGLPGFIELYSIWGNSPDDVWGAGFTEDVRNCFWHYDGIKWSRAVWNTPITEFGNGSKSVGGVWGTAKNDVWAFGGRLFSNPDREEPFVMHYDGVQWTEVTGDKNQMPMGCRDIYPLRKDHFWICSSEYVSEYKDGIWKKFYIGENLIIESIEGIGSSIYLTAYPIGVDSLYLIKISNNKIEIVDYTKLFGGNGKFGTFGLIFNNEKVFSFDNYSIYTASINNNEIKNDTWQKELLVLESGFFESFKTSNKDIWAVGANPSPYHYNGSDWQPINIYKNNSSLEKEFRGIWGNGSEIFIADIENGVIYHGK